MGLTTLPKVASVFITAAQQPIGNYPQGLADEVMLPPNPVPGAPTTLQQMQQIEQNIL